VLKIQRIQSISAYFLISFISNLYTYCILDLKVKASITEDSSSLTCPSSFVPGMTA